ncbi:MULTISPECIES: maleate cis-trans isomerase family protein [Actinopolyspora]|uniref:Maleate isomerase n=1 Tax=Actinopolyspora saharensis TaxID=995062 RepID=A0A1H0Z7C1_9ACTN|nr:MULTISPECIES: aspartate/glutamate racemase family protein [Actinopolyspora]NHD15945.1 Asp/Glu racemase [Actinopolyspora sp. BKK2]NHE74841.1 Asp/Glu racemase [Actinopolyspora sp. BKK1]SDQ23342.1 maleate isomerase [Actinopolyspora saharensis]
MTTQRIGLIVPSSNVTMETEIPALLGHEDRTYHSSRAVLHNVDAESLHAMVGEGDRCAGELADAGTDVIGYACLIALMAEGAGAHERVERELGAVTTRRGAPCPVVSSAGALVRTLLDLNLRRVTVVAPYVPALTGMVLEYLSGYGITVVDSLSLGVADNREVGRLDPAGLPELAERLDRTRVDGVVLSACVQMPSLSAVEPVQRALGLPVVTAATATARELLSATGTTTRIPGGGAALDEEVRRVEG